jgi:hypothetical protein
MHVDTVSPKPERGNFRWDVFLSYRGADRSAVSQIAQKLRDMRLKVWWDEWEVPPGADFQQSLWDGLKKSWATAVFIGPSTVMGWQELEVKGAINEQVKSGKPVLPIFLPGVLDPDKIDLEFLGLNSRVVFERSLDEQRVYDRMVWGITGINPDRPSPESAPAPAAEAQTTTEGFTAEAVKQIASWLKSGNVTFFIGPAVAGGEPVLPLQNWEIALKLLREIHLIGTDDVEFLPSVDIAATLYGISETDPVLEDTVISLIQSRSAEIPAVQRSLGDLLARLARRELPRGRKLQKQLILTMNIDLMMERALLRAGVGFTRVVQHKSERELYVTNYHDPSLMSVQADKLDDAIQRAEAMPLAPEAVAGSVLAEPILFKLRGSQDLSGSCALTRPQLLAQARSVIAEHLIPAELQKVASNTPMVFLGIGVLDPEFQYMSHTVLYNAWESDHPKYLVQVPPAQDQEDRYRRVEAILWGKIKQSALRRNLATVEEPSARFLNRLITAL